MAKNSIRHWVRFAEARIPKNVFDVKVDVPKKTSGSHESFVIHLAILIWTDRRCSSVDVRRSMFLFFAYLNVWMEFMMTLRLSRVFLKGWDCLPFREFPTKSEKWWWTNFPQSRSSSSAKSSNTSHPGLFTVLNLQKTVLSERYSTDTKISLRSFDTQWWWRRMRRWTVHSWSFGSYFESNYFTWGL